MQDEYFRSFDWINTELLLQINLNDDLNQLKHADV